jgi:uncharacterized membrane protein YdjX (TVP38/TMEM64 family)
VPAPLAGTEDSPTVPRIPAWSRLLLLAAGLAAASAAVLVSGGQRLLTGEFLGAPTPGALLLFVLGYAACSVVLVPRPVMSVAGGALFGAGTGTAAGLAGTVLGAAAAFALGRRYARPSLLPMLRGRWPAAAERQLSRRGFRSVLVLRLIPVLPFAGVNHAAAVSRMPARDFLGATALGCLPGIAVCAVAGSRATEPLSPGLVSAVALLALSGPLSVAVWRRRRTRIVHDPPLPTCPPGLEGPDRTITPDLRIDR